MATPKLTDTRVAELARLAEDLAAQCPSSGRTAHMWCASLDGLLELCLRRDAIRISLLNAVPVRHVGALRTALLWLRSFRRSDFQTAELAKADKALRTVGEALRATGRLTASNEQDRFQVEAIRDLIALEDSAAGPGGHRSRKGPHPQPFAPGEPRWRQFFETIARKMDNLMMRSGSATETLRGLLEEMIRTVAGNTHPANAFRAYVMLPVNGRRRRVQAESAVNMQGDSDQNLELDHEHGVSGQALSHRATVLVDLRVATDDQFGLSREGIQLNARRTLTIVSCPLYRPAAPLAHTSRPLLGTLNLDSTLSLDELKWSPLEEDGMNDVLWQVRMFAEFVASILMYGGLSS